jgi:SOS-response transcriptional repressor LexA
VHLLPENPAFQPIVVDVHSREFIIEGVVVGVLRDVTVQ